jgi:hypothetical protein
VGERKEESMKYKLEEESRSKTYASFVTSTSGSVFLYLIVY